MATLFKEVKYTLLKLIEDIHVGEIGLPDIQRPFVWGNNRVRDLFDSMYQGFPVGYLLFWANGVDNDHRQIGIDEKQKYARLLIVDGQQRLTSLYAVMKGAPIIHEDYSESRIYIGFRPRDGKFVVADASTWRDPEFIPDISVLWEDKFSSFKFINEFLANVKNSHEINEDEENQIAKAIDNLIQIKSYPFTAIELSSKIGEEQVAEVFVRINSKAKTLNQSDFILTLLSVFWDEGRKQLEEFCRDAKQPSKSRVSSYNYFLEPSPDQLLRVSTGLGFRRARLQHIYSILRGKDMDTQEFSTERRDQQFEILKKAQNSVLDNQYWHDFMKCLSLAGYRGHKMISSDNVILYSYVFYLIGKTEFGINEYSLRKTISKWFFMSSLTRRYSGSFESRMEQDLTRLGDVQTGDDFISFLDKIVKDTLTNDFWEITLPNELATSSSRSPSLFSYYASLCILDATVLFSRLKVSDLIDSSIRTKKSAVERHHLFPKNYLKLQGIKETRDQNEIANYALVEWGDNIEISDDNPKFYYPEYAKRFNAAELERMEYWHGLPKNWFLMEYSDFLLERRKVIAKVIKDAYYILENVSE